jgi:hypothetical protein
MELTGALLDGRSYAIEFDRGDGTPVERVVAPDGATALSFDLISKVVGSAHGNWTFPRVRSFPSWLVQARPQRGDLAVATAGPAWFGANSYAIRMASGPRFRMRLNVHRWCWQVRGAEGLALELKTPSNRAWSLDIRSTGLSQAELCVLIGLVLLMEQTNSVDNSSSPHASAGP